jgi:hypothetical protein
METQRPITMGPHTECQLAADVVGGDVVGAGLRLQAKLRDIAKGWDKP